MDARLRVLIVEDSDDDTALLLRELERGGFQTVHRRVESADEMRSALNQPWDVIFSDFSVPGFNSHRAFSLLKESGQDIPFVIVSGTIGEEAAVSAMKAGVSDYFLKGHLGRLIPALQRELREASGRRRRRVAEESLREYQERLALLAQTTNDALWEWNAESRSLWWHDALPRLFGFPPGDARPSLAFFVGHLHPEDREGVMRSLRRLLRTGVRTWSREFRFARANGDYAVAFARGTVVRATDGTARRIVGALVDITEKRRMEEQLRQAQKIEAVGRLAGGVAHDFNNLLTAVLGYSDELRREVGGASARAAESIAEIERCVERGAALTRQLLAFSRKQVVRPQVLDLNVVVKDMGRMLRRMLGDDIELVTKLSGELGSVKADPGHMEQVLMNLAVNGRDAMPRGGSLTLSTSNTTLTKEDAAIRPEILPGRYVSLTVTDTGHGMDADTLSHLFEPFFTTKAPGHGTGLGLATVYGIVKQHRGYVYADSELYHGTSVRVYLPILTAEEAKQVPIPRSPRGGQSDAPARGWETVMLVDDNDSVRQFAQRFLERQGYRVLSAGHPAEALRLADATPDGIHLLVTDLRMPTMGGRELAERVAATRPGLRCLYMSGFAEAEDLENGRDAGFLSKPFTGHELLMRVRRALDQDQEKASKSQHPGQ